MSRLSDKSGAVWVCGGVRVDPMTQGHIYKFTIPDELYQQEEKQQVAAFPAIEITTNAAYSTIYGNVLNEIPAILLFPEQLKSIAFDDQLNALYHFLGYGFRWICESYDPNHYLELPDHKTLIARWEMLRTYRPSLPKLDILEADGIAGDLEFVDAYLNHDILLSNGAEFVHDHYGHVLRTIEFIWRCGSADAYQHEKAQYAERVHYGRELMRAYDENAGNVRSRVNLTEDEVAILKTSLGLMADFSSAVSNKMDRFWGPAFDSFKLILDIGGEKDEGYIRFLKDIGVNTSEDSIKIYQNWFQIIFAVNGRLSDYTDIHESILLQDTPDGTYVRCSENSLAIKIDNGIEQFDLAVHPINDGNSEEYQVTISSGKVLRVVAETKLRELPEEFIKEILIAEKKAKNLCRFIEGLTPVHRTPQGEQVALHQESILRGGAAISSGEAQHSVVFFAPANHSELTAEDTSRSTTPVVENHFVTP